MPRAAIVLLADDEGRKIVRRHCRRAKLAIGDLERLFDELMRSSGVERRRALFAVFDDVLDAPEEEGEL
ncbi:MAG: hypothetical protein IT204_09950 [Fimbriimonadaceae bacterium]|nr:hypothetical protein [Fimbriimonadaceae bacterium]